MVRISAVLWLAVALLGCGEDPQNPPVVVDLPDADATDVGVEPDVDVEPDAEMPVEIPQPVAADWCVHHASALAVDRPAPVSWSAAHALARFFGPHAGSVPVDAALAAAFDGADPAFEYADRLPFVCLVDASPLQPLGAAMVDVVDGVAHVRPGTGEVVVPDDATRVVLDLRSLPADPALDEALRTAAAAVLPAPIARRVEARTITGLPDEVYFEGPPYGAVVGPIDLEPWPGEAPERPLAVWIDGAPAPRVAALAGAIRMSGSGWLLGHGLASGVAESRLFAVGEFGLAVRWGTFVDGDGTPWPDVIPADGFDDRALTALYAQVEIPAVEGPAERPRVEAYNPFNPPLSAEPGPGARRAMLITAHGALRRFFPYFDIVGDRIDERLMETLSTLDDDGPFERADTRALLRRMAEAISDGHAFVIDRVESEGRPAPIAVDHLEDGSPVVRRSRELTVRPGDVITAIDGQTAEDWYAEELTRTSAASRGYALDLASRRYLIGPEPLMLTLRDLGGQSRDIALPRVGGFANAPSTTPWLHPTGFLDAFGAPGVYYVNMAGDVEDDSASLLARMQENLPAAEALVVDMRGYPGTDHYRVAMLIVGGDDLLSPVFEVPTWTGPDQLNISRDQYDGRAFGGAGVEGFAGPVALLVGPTSVSAAENFSMMLSPFEQVTVIGRASAATNGNITGVWLPGGLALTFTGMGILFPDGGLFHGLGVVPDIEIWPTAESLGNADDIELTAAIEHVSAE